MRLDHLLSKEQLALVMGVQQAVSGPTVFWRLLMGGTFDMAPCLRGAGLVRWLSGWLERFVFRGCGACTLLGPEGPGFRLFLGRGGFLDRGWVSFVGAAFGTDRTLRTTQWTRAS